MFGFWHLKSAGRRSCIVGSGSEPHKRGKGQSRRSDRSSPTLYLGLDTDDDDDDDDDDNPEHRANPKPI